MQLFPVLHLRTISCPSTCRVDMAAKLCHPHQLVEQDDTVQGEVSKDGKALRTAAVLLFFFSSLVPFSPRKSLPDFHGR